MERIPKEERKKRKAYVGILAAAALLVLAGLCAAGIRKQAKPLPAADPDEPISGGSIPAASAGETAEGDPARYGLLMPAAPPYITCGGRL